MACAGEKGQCNMFKGRQFDRSVILLCVRKYLAYDLGLRDREKMKAERGTVDHATIQRWPAHCCCPSVSTSTSERQAEPRSSMEFRASARPYLAARAAQTCCSRRNSGFVEFPRAALPWTWH
jgi:hypothetical protein